MTVGVCVREGGGGGAGNNENISCQNSLLWIEKAAILPVVVWQPLRVFFFEANVVHPQPGIPVNARA